jgi:hypothetical protein
MTTRIALIILLATSSVLGTACRNSKKAAAKEESTVSEVSTLHRERWLSVRVTELTKAGTSPDQAALQAKTEYETRFEYMNKPK